LRIDLHTVSDGFITEASGGRQGGNRAVLPDASLWAIGGSVEGLSRRVDNWQQIDIFGNDTMTLVPVTVG